MSIKKIGVLGGSFNPIHKGHTALATAAKAEYRLDDVLLIPDKIPPHKSPDGLVSEEHRLNMCLIAAKNAGLSVSDIEHRLSGASYTYRTLGILKEMYNESELWLICGTDMFNTLLSWKEPEKIFGLCTVCGLYRQGEDYEKMLKMQEKYLKIGAKTHIFKADLPCISSTMIRNKLKSGDTVDGLLDPDVYSYIVKNNLYKD